MRISNFFRSRFRLLLAAAWLTLTAAALQAEVIHVGYLQLASGNPSEGLTSILVGNMTGSGCDAVFNSCSTIGFYSAVLQIHYLDSLGAPQVFTANLPDGFGPGVTDPFLFPDFTVDATGWTIGLVSLSGTLSPTDFVLFDPVAGRRFQPAAFSGSFDAAAAAGALLTAEALPLDESAVPEPGTSLLTGAGLTLAAACAAHRRNWRRQS